MASSLLSRLRYEHTPERIRARILGKPPLARLHLRDAVLGGMDGCITTFAIVAGAAGASLPSLIVVILGFSNLVADGLSMAIGNYLGVKSEREQLAAARREEQEHIDLIPEGEKEEIRQIFSNKGFEGEPLDRIVETVAGNRNWWVDIMIREEWGLSSVSINPLHAALVTFFAFITVGIAPLLPYTLFSFENAASGFVTSCMATMLAFIVIGIGRAKMTQRSIWRCMMETFLAGAVAAGAAYGIGYSLVRLF
jgi:vacuolar iron transporter family protein